MRGRAARATPARVFLKLDTIAVLLLEILCFRLTTPTARLGASPRDLCTGIPTHCHRLAHPWPSISANAVPMIGSRRIPCQQELHWNVDKTHQCLFRIKSIFRYPKVWFFHDESSECREASWTTNTTDARQPRSPRPSDDIRLRVMTRSGLGNGFGQNERSLR